MSKRAHCGPVRVLRLPGSHKQQQRSWPSSSPACSRKGKDGLVFRHPLGESRPRRRRFERVREVLGLVRDQVVTVLHDAHRVGRHAVVCDLHSLTHSEPAPSTLRKVKWRRAGLPLRCSAMVERPTKRSPDCG